MTTLELQEELTDLYIRNADPISKGTGEPVNRHRERAMNDFKKLGIPTAKNENYRYTDLMNYFKGEYLYEVSPSSFSVNLEELFKCDVPELETYIILVVNGFYYQHNKPVDLPKGVIIDSFANASIKYPAIMERHYAHYADTSIDALAALNTLFAQDGVFIHIPKGVELSKPVQIINIGYSFGDLRIVNRNLIIAEEDSVSSLLICDHTLCKQSFFTNSLTEIYAGERARLDLLRMQNENSNSTQLSNTFIHQEKNSDVTTNTLSLHGGLIRNNLFVKLQGEGAQNAAYGISFGDGTQHLATFTHIHHAQPDCHSEQLFKSILDGSATGSFNGKILVDKYAQKTRAYQRSNNILLSKTSRMNTKPQLEIYNDDVKCSHGATTGQINNDAMFYLRSRGIGQYEARQLLMFAFAHEVVNKIKLKPLQERMTELVEKRLRGELSHCENCNIRHIT